MDYHIYASIGVPEHDAIIDHIELNGEFRTQVLKKVPGTKNEYKVDVDLGGHVNFAEVLKGLQTNHTAEKDTQ